MDGELPELNSRGAIRRCDQWINGNVQSCMLLWDLKWIWPNRSKGSSRSRRHPSPKRSRRRSTSRSRSSRRRTRSRSYSRSYSKSPRRRSDADFFFLQFHPLRFTLHVWVMWWIESIGHWLGKNFPGLWMGPCCRSRSGSRAGKSRSKSKSPSPHTARLPSPPRRRYYGRKKDEASSSDLSASEDEGPVSKEKPVSASKPIPKWDSFRCMIAPLHAGELIVFAFSRS